MRLYIQDKNSLIKYNLPKKVDGSLLFNFRCSETDMEYALNIDADGVNTYLEAMRSNALNKAKYAV